MKKRREKKEKVVLGKVLLFLLTVCLPLLFFPMHPPHHRTTTHAHTHPSPTTQHDALVHMQTWPCAGAAENTVPFQQSCDDVIFFFPIREGFTVQGFSKFSGRLCIISGNGRANIFQIAKGGGRVSKLVEEVLQR